MRKSEQTKAKTLRRKPSETVGNRRMTKKKFVKPKKDRKIRRILFLVYFLQTNQFRTKKSRDWLQISHVYDCFQVLRIEF